MRLGDVVNEHRVPGDRGTLNILEGRNFKDGQHESSEHGLPMGFTHLETTKHGTSVTADPRGPFPVRMAEFLAYIDSAERMPCVTCFDRLPLYTGTLVASDRAVMLRERIEGKALSGGTARLSDVKDALSSCPAGWCDVRCVNRELATTRGYTIEADTMLLMWAKLEAKGWLQVEGGKAGLA